MKSTMSRRAVSGERLLRWLFILLTPIVPALVAYDIYFQWTTPVVDCTMDWHTGLVLEVPRDSFANWAGLHEGDVILTIGDLPFAEWDELPTGSYAAEVVREGAHVTLELPLIPMAKINLVSMVSAAAVALTFWAFGALLFLRRFRQREVRLLFPLAQAFAILLLFPLAHPPPSVVPVWTFNLSYACFYLAAPLLLHLYLTFPVVLGTPRRRHWGLVVIYGLAAAATILGLSGHPLGRIGSTYTILEVVAAVAVLVYVYLRRATPDGRRRLRLVVFGNVVAAVPCIFFYILPFMTGAAHGVPEWLAALFLVVAPLSYLYATIRHNLFEIDQLLNRTVVYLLLYLGILALYLGPFLLLYRFLPYDPVTQILLGVGLTLVIGLGFDWTRTRVQRLVDRVFYGGWYDYPGVVETVSDRLTRSLEREELADVLTHQVPEMMQLRRGWLWVGEPGDAPQQSEHPLQIEFPLVHQGRVQGVWTVAPRRDGQEFTAGDRRILKTLAHQAEMALSNVLLVETLRRQLEEIRKAQHQLLRSREEERARLARELHDGPIQTLVGLNLQVGMALSQEASGSPMNEVLSGARAEVRYLLGELRQVCAELRPPMLDTLGLNAALRALAEEWSAQHDISVRLELPLDDSLRSLPDEVAVNLYRVAQEGLSNVAHHAQAGQVAIRLTWKGPHLALSIRDDGRGFTVPQTLHDLAAGGHFGLVGIQERADLIGGQLTIRSAPGEGTTVRVVV
jgi:signal transduction histidine kinase